MNSAGIQEIDLKKLQKILTEMTKILNEVITDHAITTGRIDWAEEQLKKTNKLFSKISEL